MYPGVLAWSAERGCILTAQEVVEAVRRGEMLVAVDDDHVVRGVDGAAPLAAMVRADSDTAGLREEMTRLSACVEGLHDRLMEIAEASVEVLARR